MVGCGWFAVCMKMKKDGVGCLVYRRNQRGWHWLEGTALVGENGISGADGASIGRTFAGLV